MALIRCPECGKEISDMAQACPSCGYPIKVVPTDRELGIVKIKLDPLDPDRRVKQNAEISLLSGKVLWSGTVGSVARLKLNAPTPITVKYKTNLMQIGAKCEGVVDPKKYTRYVVYLREGVISNKLVIEHISDDDF